ncbi:cytochrome P450 [Streptomyces sp. NPDC006235]|uniref:cytochrome P450 n=1 Tax=Streptomyces sp. NPDC006235 TaxID=3156736 RepID=UPI0033A4DFE9
MLDVFGDFSANDPAAALAEAAKGCPYQWQPETQALYALRAGDVRQVLTSKDFWSERAPDRRAAALSEDDRQRRTKLKEFLALWPVFSDGEHHRRVRRVAIRPLRQVVTPALLGSWERLAGRRLAEAGEDAFDWVDHIARPLARETIAALTGSADADRLIDLGGLVMNELATSRIEMARIDAALEAIDELRDWLRTALTDPPSAFVAGLAELWDDEKFGPDSATALLTQIITGAHDPVVTALCVAGERVTGDMLTELSPRTVREEVFRIATPFRFASRYARRPVTVGSHRLNTGDRIVLCLGTANLDPDFHPAPLEFRRRTTSPRSLSFGAGEHYCPGAPLAHAIVGVLLDSLADLGVHFSVENAEREPELAMLRYRRLVGRLVRHGSSRAVPRPSS